MVIHYINKEHPNYPKTVCGQIYPKGKTYNIEEITCKVCLRLLEREAENKQSENVQARRDSFFKRSEKVNLQIKGIRKNAK